MKAGRIAAATVIGMGMMLLGGCEKLNQKEAWSPKEPSAISISEEGTITEYVSDTLDASYYSASELENMIKSEVNDYNAKNGENSVQIREFSAENGSVALTMEYAKSSDYAAFNNVEFYYGSMINAQLEGYLFDGLFWRVKSGEAKGNPVSGSEVLKNMAAEVLIVTAPLEVHVPGTVIYTGVNSEVLASDDVNATGTTKEDQEEGLELPSSAVYTGEEKNFDEKAAARRVYIVFEME